MVDINILILCDQSAIEDLSLTLQSVATSKSGNYFIYIKAPTERSRKCAREVATRILPKGSFDIIELDDSSPGEAINQLLEQVDAKYFQLLPAGDVVSYKYYEALVGMFDYEPDALVTASVVMNSECVGIYQAPKDFFSDLKRGTIGGHLSSLIIKSAALRGEKFDARYQLADDISFLLNISVRIHKTLPFPLVTTIAKTPGRSADETRAAIELFHIYRKRIGSLQAARIFITKISKLQVKRMIKRLKNV